MVLRLFTQTETALMHRLWLIIQCLHIPVLLLLWPHFNETVTIMTLLGQTGLSIQCKPYQMPQNVASDQGLHCLPLIQQFLYGSIGRQTELFKFFFTSMFRSYGVPIFRVFTVESVKP